MSRDNYLFIVIGVLVGFIAGYLLQEVMADRQPPRLVHGDDTAAPPAVAGAAGGQAPSDAEARMRALVEEMRGLESYLAENPEDAEATLRLGTLSIEVGNWAGCVQALERYVELRAETPDLLSDLGICYSGIGSDQRALELFDRAQEIEPDHWQSRFNEAMVLGLEMEDFAAADRVIEELRALRPADPQVDRLVQEIERRRSA